MAVGLGFLFFLFLPKPSSPPHIWLLIRNFSIHLKQYILTVEPLEGKKYKKSGIKVFIILFFLSFFPAPLIKGALHALFQKKIFQPPLPPPMVVKYKLLVE